MKKSVLLLLLLLPILVSAQDFDLQSYPAPFVINGLFDAKVVIGKNAATNDVLGGIDIAASLIAQSQANIALTRMNSLLDSHIGVHDIEAPIIGSENLIVVGGPCANSVAAELLNYPVPCNKGFEVGKAIIKYFPGKRAILVAGYEAQETLAASYVLSDHEDYDLRGDMLEITIAGQDVLALNPVVT